MTFTISQDHTLPAPPRRVFQALTTSTDLTQWFAEFVDIDPTEGGSYRFWGRHTLGVPSEDAASQQITAFQPDEAIGYTWEIAGVPSEVRIAVRPAEGGTRLTVHHRIDGDLGVARQHDLIDDHWRLATSNLSAYLAEGHGLALPDYTDTAPVVRHVVRIDAPPSVVFRALIEPSRIDRWLGARSEVEPKVGGKYALNWKYKVHGREVTGGPTHIQEFVRDERLVLDWPDWRGDRDVPDQTITYELHPNGLGGTSLTFTHARFSRVADMGDYGVGWLAFLDELRKEVMS